MTVTDLKISQGAIEKTEMPSVMTKIATEKEFFKQGRALARLADTAQPLPEEYTVSFEEPDDLLRLSMSAHLA